MARHKRALAGVALLAMLGTSPALAQQSERMQSMGIGSANSPIDVCLAFGDEGQTCIPAASASALGNDIDYVLTNRSDAPRYVALARSSDTGFSPERFADGATTKLLRPGERVTIKPRPQFDGVIVEMVVLQSPTPFDPVALLRSSLPAGMEVASLMNLSGTEPMPAAGGGEPVAFGESDWMVAIYDPRPFSETEIRLDNALPAEKRVNLEVKTPEERAHSCGGAMMADNVVITAAHCVASGAYLGSGKAKVFKERRVRLGSLRLGRGGETRAIIGMAVHAGYNGAATGQPNDIALLLLKRDDRIHLRPRTLSIATRSAGLSDLLMVLGWGYTKQTRGSLINMMQDGGAQRNAVALQKAPMQPITRAECVRALGAKVTDGMLCAGTPRARLAAGGPPTFSCRGDSGGPLVRGFGGGGDELVGLVSWSVGCGNGKPSVFTDVPAFAKWIAAARLQLKPGVVAEVPEPARASRAPRRR